jgi:hypothetical protein
MLLAGMFDVGWYSGRKVQLHDTKQEMSVWPLDSNMFLVTSSALCSQIPSIMFFF